MTSRKDAPTSDQLRALEALGIKPPKTRKSCWFIMDWINGGGTEKNLRIGLLQEGQHWVGKRVRGTTPHTKEVVGIVEYVVPKVPSALVHRAEMTEHNYRNPLDARIKGDSGKSHLLSLGTIELVPETS